jgi:hypothetical protein
MAGRSKALSPRSARRIDLCADSPLVEGVILSVDQVVDAAARR